MDTAVFAGIEELRQMKTAALRIKYREVFGEETRSSNRQFLFRRIAWRLQANVEGDLSERTRQRALEIANDSDLRICAPEGFFIKSGSVDLSPFRPELCPHAIDDAEVVEVNGDGHDAPYRSARRGTALGKLGSRC